MRWILEQGQPTYDEDGEPLWLDGVMFDVTERKHLEDRLAYDAAHDPLTGLPNRTLLLETLDRSLKRASRTHMYVAVLFLDLDRFKLVNDALGHAAGDDLLIALAQRLAGRAAGLRPRGPHRRRRVRGRVHGHGVAGRRGASRPPHRARRSAPRSSCTAARCSSPRASGSPSPTSTPPAASSCASPTPPRTGPRSGGGTATRSSTRSCGRRPRPALETETGAAPRARRGPAGAALPADRRPRDPRDRRARGSRSAGSIRSADCSARTSSSRRPRRPD